MTRIYAAIFFEWLNKLLPRNDYVAGLSARYAEPT